MSLYHLPARYVRQRPDQTHQHDDHRKRPGGPVWQPDVYPHAVRRARDLGAEVLVDIGCGNGRRVAEYGGEFETIGLDRPDTAERIELPGSWFGVDLNQGDPLPVRPETLARSVVICSDVIEHLQHPERLLSVITLALEHAHCAIISTPDRDRTRGVGSLGPPSNVAHVQEWNMDEFVAWLTESGLTVTSSEFTRSNSTSISEATILVEATIE